MTITALAALGSSFAAGPGLTPVADRRAMRSERNYPHLAAHALGATLLDATVSGATTDTILSTPQRSGLTRFPPQIERLTPDLDLDLVTITAGGNDLGYLGSMIRTALGDRFGRRPLTRALGRRMRGVPVPVPAEQVQSAATGLTRVVDAVAERAPKARILLVDYLTIIGPDTRASAHAPFTTAELANFRRTAEQLAAAFAQAASSTKAELIAISTLSETHAVGAAEPWVNGLNPGFAPSALASCFHPNAAGMQAVADAIVEQVGGV